MKNTNGAGDAFAAGVLSALLREKEPEESIYWGNFVASKAISEEGARIKAKEYSEKEIDRQTQKIYRSFSQEIAE